jgi:hypothetical protein
VSLPIATISVPSDHEASVLRRIRQLVLEVRSWFSLNYAKSPFRLPSHCTSAAIKMMSTTTMYVSQGLDSSRLLPTVSVMVTSRRPEKPIQEDTTGHTHSAINLRPLPHVNSLILQLGNHQFIDQLHGTLNNSTPQPTCCIVQNIQNSALSATRMILLTPFL